jgi:hypothetical protein
MTILLSLLLFHFLTLFIGRYADRINFLGYVVVGVLTVIQVAVFMYLLYNMEVPTP